MLVGLPTKDQQHQKTEQEPRPTKTIPFTEAIPTEMFRVSIHIKIFFESDDKNIKDIQNRVDCLQRSQVYIHNHISKVEADVRELKDLILRRLADSGSFVTHMAEVN